jgi:hypothetical protein
MTPERWKRIDFRDRSWAGEDLDFGVADGLISLSRRPLSGLSRLPFPAYTLSSNAWMIENFDQR